MIDERLIATDYSDEMKKSFIDYAMSVIVDRALPDVRDGLKPVHRRILYSMYESGFTPDKPHRKSVATVGEVMKKYHPHGDMSIYDALVRMAQDFSLAHPLVDGHGNFGSIDGDPPAAFRYTEARLREVALEVIGDTGHDTVDFIPNFDGREVQPLVLPSRFPNLLVNGTTGIAVGMATNMPPHNLVEVIKAVFDYIDHPDITVARLMKHIKGPDFPTGGIICNPDVLADIYETGTSSGGLDENGRKGKRKNSSIRIRSKVEVESIGNGKTNLVITEIPYTWSGSKDKFKERIIDLVKDGELDELSEVRDESGREGIRIVLEVKKGIDLDNLLNKLYKKTPIEDTMSVNFLALVPDMSDPHKLKPEVLNLKELIRHYVAFQKEITTRKYLYLLPKEKERKEILEGMIRAHDVIDLIIEVIRGGKDVKSVKHCLVTGDTADIALKTKKSEKEAARLDFTERQADAILAMQLQRLVGIELQRLHEEHRAVCGRIADYENILGSESALTGVIKGYLIEMRKKFGQRRKTVIEEHPVAEYVEAVIIEELVVLIDKFGYAKTVDAAVFNRANGEASKDFKHMLPCVNTDRVCMFTSEGNLYQVKVADLPRGRIKDKGVPLDTLAGYGKETCLFIKPFGHIRDRTMIFTTRHGMMKRVGGAEFESNRTQTASTKLNAGDELVDIRLAGTNPKGRDIESGMGAARKTRSAANADEITGTQDAESTHVVLLTGRGYLLKFPLQEVPVLKKAGKGVKAIALVKEDTVCGLFLLAKSEERIELLNGREINLSRMKTKKRNQIGVKT